MTRVIWVTATVVFVAIGATGAPQDAPAPPAVYRSGAEIAAALEKLGTSTAAATGANVPITPQVVVRRRSAGGEPQFAIIHPFSTEVYQIIDGSGTLVTGGRLSPAPFETVSPDVIRTTSIIGGEARKVGKGDVLVLPPGTPHWFREIDGSITYLEARLRTVN